MNPALAVSLVGELVSLALPLIERIKRIQQEDPALWAEISAKYPQAVDLAKVQLDKMKPTPAAPAPGTTDTPGT